MSRPNNAPAYYLGRPASLWLSLGRRRRLRTTRIPAPPRRLRTTRIPAPPRRLRTITIPVPPRRLRTITIPAPRPRPRAPLDDRVRVGPGGRSAPG
jgi:hypothetical protein